MLLKDLLLNNREVLSSDMESIAINKIQYDSRKIEKGDLFIAVKGFETDGHQYLQQVYEKGAAAAIVQDVNPHIGLKQIVVSDSRAAMAALAYNYYKDHLQDLDLIGITGTNGKTTCSYLIHSMLEAAGISCGLAGTIHYVIGTKRVEAWNTTPEAVDLYKMLAEMQQAGNRACVLEVSSHALALKRVSGLRFKVAVFTNLSRDHMDFHKDMDTYFSDKCKLFDQLSETGHAVINKDDSYGKEIKIKNNMISFGMDSSSAVYSENWQTDAAGTKVEIQTAQGKIVINSSLVGTFNVYNILTTVGAGLAMQIAPESIKKGIENIKSVPGRLEKYPLKNGAIAVIDYAHTPDALEKALSTLKKITSNNLIVVFGCGGDRDKGKRPQMGRVAQHWADIIYVTDDNPRTEESMKIIDDILTGMEKTKNVHVIANRKDAIIMSVKNAKEGDIILIAGKGHETYQVIGKVKHDFDEAMIIREAEKDA
jgi:UDP-N-acetylmuramoyl-L-alanyl-D-glutamate--2,6-diaminopimelate ligase